tara:strand:- start:18 stop:1130 length:1113 start_codon:yes stop_codon:yes gene_type:complete
MKDLPRNTRERTVGRLNDCDIVILDPENRVSRKHAMLKTLGRDIFIKDLGSANGTYVSGTRINKGEYQKLNTFDKVTLSQDYVFEFNIYINKPSGDSTLILGPSNDERTVIFEPNRVTVRSADKTVVFDPEKTAISDLSDIDTSPYKKLGRNSTNDYVVDNNNVSREHCKIRLLTPQIIEIEDLGSANGTFADGTKLVPKKKYKFGSSVIITLSNSYNIDLKKVFTDVQIVRKKPNPASPSNPVNRNKNHQGKEPIIAQEKATFDDLEKVWNEFNDRNRKAGKIGAGYGIGGAAVGLAAMSFIPGGIAVSAGIGLLGRYIGQRKSNEIRDDLSYENMFLEVYCCPRCKESFQRKPWVTIRDCFKCKIKFR